MEKLVQTGIRMDVELLERLKLEAKRQGLSLNSLMVRALASSITPVLPKLNREDFPDDPELEGLSIDVKIPQELIDSDPRIAKILAV